MESRLQIGPSFADVITLLDLVLIANNFLFCNIHFVLILAREREREFYILIHALVAVNLNIC